MALQKVVSVRHTRGGCKLNVHNVAHYPGETFYGSKEKNHQYVLTPFPRKDAKEILVRTRPSGTNPSSLYMNVNHFIEKDGLYEIHKEAEGCIKVVLANEVTKSLARPSAKENSGKPSGMVRANFMIGIKAKEQKFFQDDRPIMGEVHFDNGYYLRLKHVDQQVFDALPDMYQLREQFKDLNRLSHADVIHYQYKNQSKEMVFVPIALRKATKMKYKQQWKVYIDNEDALCLVPPSETCDITGKQVNTIKDSLYRLKTAQEHFDSVEKLNALYQANASKLGDLDLLQQLQIVTKQYQQTIYALAERLGGK